jgi:hypothetical protein
VTAQGKAKVIANAITHGAKAKNFINADEEQAYMLSTIISSTGSII